MNRKESDEKKTERLLSLWDVLGKGGVVNRADLIRDFDVNTRTASRYFAEIRRFLEIKGNKDGIRRELHYDRKSGTYRIRELENEMISSAELLALGKILLASRAFHKTELESLLRRMIQSAVLGKEKEEVASYIRGELFDYENPKHEDPDVNDIWTIARAIRRRHVVSFGYRRQGKEEQVPHRVCPKGLLFSEYYFYMVGTPEDEIHNHNCSTRVYRLDRMSFLKEEDRSFDMDYASRLREGKFKNSVQFMYSGEREQVEFIYKGPSVEAVLDRLPSAKSEKLPRPENAAYDHYRITVDNQGEGILMWLLSQGSKVDVRKPEKLREKWLNEIRTILEDAEKLEQDT